MRRVFKRNTGRNMCRMSFLDEEKNIDKLEKVSKRRMISQSQLIRDFIQDGLRGWDCQVTFSPFSVPFFFFLEFYVLEDIWNGSPVDFDSVIYLKDLTDFGITHLLILLCLLLYLKHLQEHLFSGLFSFSPDLKNHELTVL